MTMINNIFNWMNTRTLSDFESEWSEREACHNFGIHSKLWRNSERANQVAQVAPMTELKFDTNDTN